MQTSNLESVAMAHGQLQHHHHALVLPFPLQGHISPLLQLSQHLAGCHGFRITFVNTEYNHARILMQQQVEAPMENSSNGSSRKYNSNIISMVGVSDGLPMEAERGALGVRRVVASMAVCARPRLEQLISDINTQVESSNAITCIITDLYMLSWARDLANTCDIPAVIAFNASSIAQFSFLYHIPFLLSSGQLNPDGTLTDVNQKQRLSGIPGVVDIPFSSVPWLGVDEDRNESIFCGLASMYDSILDQLDCILFNSFTEMEKEAVEALVKETGVKMAPVGPMLLLDSSCSTTANGESLVGVNSTASQRELDERAGGCLEWLEGRAKHSVLYIAFGTTAWLTREDLNALARGIEASEVPFVWVVRQDLVRQYGSDDQTSCTDHASAASVDHILAGDFLERTKGRAYFTSWAPQTRVLSHPAIGAFLTHGGWNSMLEAISNGVPMLLWPDFWDQKFHTEQAVEQWKVGLRVRNIHSYCAVCCKELKIDKELNVIMHDHVDELQAADAPLQLYDAADEQLVERLVRTVMSGEEGKQMRQRAAALSSKARLAVLHGSSHNNLQDVIRSLDAKIGALKPRP